MGDKRFDVSPSRSAFSSPRPTTGVDVHALAWDNSYAFYLHHGITVCKRLRALRPTRRPFLPSCSTVCSDTLTPLRGGQSRGVRDRPRSFMQASAAAAFTQKLPCGDQALLPCIHAEVSSCCSGTLPRIRCNLFSPSHFPVMGILFAREERLSSSIFTHVPTILHILTLQTYITFRLADPIGRLGMGSRLSLACCGCCNDLQSAQALGQV